jgi:carboxyl-terminal processing protease
MSALKKSKAKSRFRNVLLIYLFALSAVLLIRFSINKGVKIDRQTLTLSKNRVNQDVSSQGFKTRKSDFLAESVVSILNGYYVDEGRVDFPVLIPQTMKVLAYAIPGLKYANYENQIHSLSCNGKRTEFKHAKKIKEDEFTDELLRISEFVDSCDIKKVLTTSTSRILGDEQDPVVLTLNALLSSLDAHSSLMSVESYKDLRQGTEGVFGGLGVVVSQKNSLLQVLKTIPNSPAAKAGIQRNDEIVSIDGVQTFGKSIDDLVVHMRGKPGTKAKLDVLSHRSKTLLSYEIAREVIEVKSVTSSRINHSSMNVLHLVIESFSSKTSQEISSAINEFKRTHKPISGIVLDLRSNPGGLLDQAIKVSDLFLAEGKIVSTDGRVNEEEHAVRGRDILDTPMVVLQNEDSASAAEIVSGALKDNHRAVIVGQTSFGKGSVQTVFELPFERALKLTIARYYSPKGYSIQNHGISPDIVLQKLSTRNENLNLLGDSRFRGEAFLPNHLVTQSKSKPIIQFSKFGYYLFNEETLESDPSLMTQLNEDPEIKVAMTIFQAAKDAHGLTPTKDLARSSHLLAISENEVQNQLKEFTGQALAWLNDKYAVRWNSATSKPVDNLEVRFFRPSKDPSSGEYAFVKWKIRNPNTFAVDNMSVFVKSFMAGVDTLEQLVGSFEPGQVKTGVIKVTLPRELKGGSYHFTGGYSQNTTFREENLRDFWIDVNHAREVEIQVSGKFVISGDYATQTSQKVDIIGNVLVSIENSGETQRQNISIKVTNLGGSEFILPITERTLAKLGPGERKVISFEVRRASRKAKQSFSLGLIAKDHSQIVPQTSVVEVNLGESKEIQDSSTFSH